MTIVNTTTSLPPKKTIRLLQASPYAFYLGGSRWMASTSKDATSGVNITVHDSTDYDFYATYEPEVKDFLIANGFADITSSQVLINNKPVADKYTPDVETVLMLEHETDNVQIALKRDATFYQSVFESISPEFYYTYLWKSSPMHVNRKQITPMFNALYRAARSTQRR